VLLKGQISITAIATISGSVFRLFQLIMEDSDAKITSYSRLMQTVMIMHQYINTIEQMKTAKIGTIVLTRRLPICQLKMHNVLYA
jgi:hypothetical protein